MRDPTGALSRPQLQSVAPQLQSVAVVALAYVVAAVGGRWIGHAVGVEIQLAPGLMFALALLLGATLAWGAAIGYVVTDIVSGTLGPGTAVGFAVQFVLVGTALGLWGGFGRFSSHERPGAVSPGNLLEFGLLATTTALVAGTLTAWGSVLVGVAPFSAVVFDSVTDLLLSMSTIAPLVLYLGPRVAERYRPVRSNRRHVDTAAESAGRSNAGLWILVVAVCWAVAGFWAGIVLRALYLHDTSILVNQLGAWITTALYLSGPGGVTVQFLLGLFAIGAWVAILRSRSTPSAD